MLFFTVDLNVVLRSSSVACSSASLDATGILRSPCGNHLTVSAIRTPPVDGIQTLEAPVMFHCWADRESFDGVGIKGSSV